MRLLHPVFALVIACLTSQPALAQRDLHWRTVDVVARLDETGTLHVRETQAIVLTGDWNGGERSFNVRRGQDFSFQRMFAVDTLSGAEREMTRGDLDQVNHYDRAENNAIRWRSRLPSDPEFDGTTLTYVLEYSFSNILIPRDGSYMLDHDFAFSEREGDIQEFKLSLSLDDAWQAPPGFTGRYGPVRLSPGSGYVVTIPLGYRLPGQPTGVIYGPATIVRYSLVAALLAATALLALRFAASERQTGRFAPVEPITSIDDAWLSTHVFNMLPEEVGAAWDDSTGAPEVTAIIARMVAEQKLGSRVETRKAVVFRHHVLHLSLLVPRSALTGYERVLVDALFETGSTETDTGAIRKRYAKTGFDPSRLIKEPLERRVRSLGDRGPAVRRPSRLPTPILFFVAVALAGVAALARSSDGTVIAVAAGVSMVLYGIAVLQAVFWRVRVEDWTVHALRYMVPLLAIAGGASWLAIANRYRISALALAALAVLCLTIWHSVLNQARTRQAPELIRLRKRLASARRYFAHQLRSPRPALRDEWFPYLMAFGLGPEMDKWFRAFAGETASTIGMAKHSGGSGVTDHGGSWTGFGGGGGFAGAGSSGAWGAAVSSLAAGVSAPSSSSSSGGGGGGGGGGSSGGGGGGGW
ncbi:MAG: hypothetical protein MNPFHGCM_00511 [Gemmatimonadaceae bacterium]|nr:hypothetical protein [Gemmatimonadaceae bacterium]